MSSKSVSASAATWALTRSVVWVFPGWWRSRAAIKRTLDEKRSIGAEGLVRTHAAARLFDDFAVCGALVYSFSGPGEFADCRACRRMVAASAAADREYLSKAS